LWAFAQVAGFLCLTACAGAGSPAQPADADPFGSNWDNRTVFQETLVGSVPLDDFGTASVYHIDLVVPPDFELLLGREWIRYTNQEDQPLEEIYFQLFPNAAGGRTTVSALRIDDTEVEPVLEYLDSVIRAPLPAPLAPSQAIIVQVDFTVEISREMAGNYGLFGYFDGFLVLDGFYPVIPVFDDEGWNVQDPPPIGDVTYLDTCFYQVRVTAPRDVDLVASGSEIQRDRVGRNQVVTWAAGPARDFYLAAAVGLEVASGRAGETVINSYTPPQQQAGAELALQVAREALALFDERVGPYPYDEFDLIGTPMRALGVEYPGMTAISLAMYDLESTVAEVPAPIMLEGTVVHEVAHQWFYNVVGNDQVDEPWLDEALAQYLTGLYYREVYGDQAEQDYRQSWTSRWDRIGDEPIPIGLPTSAYAAEEYSPIVYGRGPLFLAALEDHMGRQTFAGFLAGYYETHKWGIATGETFKALAEQHCRCDLSEMFAAWVDPST
jgi:hypothetical protein